MGERQRFGQNDLRYVSGFVGIATLAGVLAGCGGKGEVVEQGAKTVGGLLHEGHVPEIPRLPHVPTGMLHSNWTVAPDGSTIERGTTVGLEQYEEKVTLQPDAADDGELNLDDVQDFMCYAKVAVQGPGTVNAFVEGRSVYQLQPGGDWQLVQNELDKGFPGSPCEVAEKAIPETSSTPQ